VRTDQETDPDEKNEIKGFNTQEEKEEFVKKSREKEGS